MESEIKLPTGKLVSELRVKNLKKQLRRPKLPTSGKKNELTARHTKGNLESRVKCASEERETDASISAPRTIKSARDDCTISTSKGRTPTTCKHLLGATSYTPHLEPLRKFIDTTKLSNRQYEIALVEDLIKRSSSTHRKVGFHTLCAVLVGKCVRDNPKARWLDANVVKFYAHTVAKMRAAKLTSRFWFVLSSPPASANAQRTLEANRAASLKGEPMQRHNDGDFEVVVKILRHQTKTSTRKTFDGSWNDSRDPQMNKKEEWQSLIGRMPRSSVQLRCKCVGTEVLNNSRLRYASYNMLVIACSVYFDISVNEDDQRVEQMPAWIITEGGERL
ncbi:hypothetical protein KIN20_027898 [Parelaphostrongylus tenuis]|uniref:SAP domain-containing protein n=1 Tax=Parelaphostrongylus tenuis TaxID=148309 RepID=A0AAD5WE62_PARTN|nr:hypothetical protein KIN20_027898 [Parelaphostrongylus tenuis]